MRRTLPEMVRVTRPGGHILIWDHNPLNPYWSLLMRRVPQDIGAERLVPMAEIVDGLRAAGADVVRADRLGLMPDFVPRPCLAWPRRSNARLRPSPVCAASAHTTWCWPARHDPAAPVHTPRRGPSPTVQPPTRRGDAWRSPFLRITALVAWNRLAFDAWLARFDLMTFFLPWYTFLGERLRALDVPGWNPHLFSGAPFAGDPESGWMYAPAMLFFTLLATMAAFKGMVALHLAIAAFSTYALARALGMGALASLVAAVAYLFGPFLHWTTHCCLIFSQFAAWIPLSPWHRAGPARGSLAGPVPRGFWAASPSARCWLAGSAKAGSTPSCCRPPTPSIAR